MALALAKARPTLWKPFEHEVVVAAIDDPKPAAPHRISSHGRTTQTSGLNRTFICVPGGTTLRWTFRPSSRIPSTLGTYVFHSAHLGKSTSTSQTFSGGASMSICVSIVRDSRPG